MKDSQTTSVERAYEALRGMAIEFEFRPGERLNEVELARRFDMSRVPLREALNRLVSENLLSAVPSRGFWARKLSVSEVTALYEVRGDLEVAAAVRVAREKDEGKLAALEDFADTMIGNIGSVPTQTLVSHDEEFHLLLARMAGNAEREATLRNVNARIRFVRQINLEAPGRMRSSLEEHLGIVRSLKDGDEAAVASIIRSHLSLSIEEAAASVQRGLARIYAEATL